MIFKPYFQWIHEISLGLLVVFIMIVITFFANLQKTFISKQLKSRGETFDQLYSHHASFNHLEKDLNNSTVIVQDVKIKKSRTSDASKSVDSLLLEEEIKEKDRRSTH